MILASDFAQLLPAIGQENALLYSRTVGGWSNIRRKAAINKAIWHQVTIFIILHKNMRQKTQSKANSKLQEALSNMQYKACTPADIAFLHSQIFSDNPNRASINDDEFHNISIIIALNNHKDAINAIRVRRFAEETGQTLCHFYSEDSISSCNTENCKKKLKS